MSDSKDTIDICLHEYPVTAFGGIQYKCKARPNLGCIPRHCDNMGCKLRKVKEKGWFTGWYQFLYQCDGCDKKCVACTEGTDIISSPKVCFAAWIRDDEGNHGPYPEITANFECNFVEIARYPMYDKSGKKIEYKVVLEVKTC